MTSVVREFYETGSAKLPSVVGTNGDVSMGSLEIRNPEFQEGSVLSLIGQLSANISAVNIPPHEIELMSVGGSDCDLFVSTLNAGATTNTPNILDAALRAYAARTEGRGFTYNALPGNSLTKGLSLSELRNYAKTGSWFRDENGELVVEPYVTAVVGVLLSTNRHPRTLLSTGHGGILQTAIGTALPKSSVGRIVQVARPGLREVALGDRVRAEVRDETENPAHLKVGYHEITDSYSHDSSNGKGLLGRGLSESYRAKTQRFVQSPIALVAHWLASGASAATLERDISVLLRQQPTARLTLVEPELDIAQNSDGATRHSDRVYGLVSRLSKLTTGQVEVVTVPGQTRNSLTSYPSILAALGVSGPTKSA